MPPHHSYSSGTRRRHAHRAAPSAHVRCGVMLIGARGRPRHYHGGRADAHNSLVACSRIAQEGRVVAPQRGATTPPSRRRRTDAESSLAARQATRRQQPVANDGAFYQCQRGRPGEISIDGILGGRHLRRGRRRLSADAGFWPALRHPGRQPDGLHLDRNAISAYICRRNSSSREARRPPFSGLSCFAYYDKRSAGVECFVRLHSRGPAISMRTSELSNRRPPCCVLHRQLDAIFGHAYDKMACFAVTAIIEAVPLARRRRWKSLSWKIANMKFRRLLGRTKLKPA